MSNMSNMSSMGYQYEECARKAHLKSLMSLKCKHCDQISVVPLPKAAYPTKVPAAAKVDVRSPLASSATMGPASKTPDPPKGSAAKCMPGPPKGIAAKCMLCATECQVPKGLKVACVSMHSAENVYKEGKLINRRDWRAPPPSYIETLTYHFLDGRAYVVDLLLGNCATSSQASSGSEEFELWLSLD